MSCAEGVTSLLEDILPALVSFAQKNKDSSRLFCAAGAVLMEFTRAGWYKKLGHPYHLHLLKNCTGESTSLFPLPSVVLIPVDDPMLGAVYSLLRSPFAPETALAGNCVPAV